MLDLREGECLPFNNVHCRDFRPSSDRGAYEIMGTIGQRLEECRKAFESCTCGLFGKPCRCVSVVERVGILERYERKCGADEQLAARQGNKTLEHEMRGDRLATGRVVAKLRTSETYHLSMALLAFTLAVAVAEDWRIRQILEGA
jgi:hypothetical protein